MDYPQKIICSESEDSPVTECENFSLKVKNILRMFASENIFKADETGLFYMCLQIRL